MRWRTGLMPLLLTALLVAALPEERAPGQAPRENKLDGPAIDALVNNTLHDVIQRGAPIYNAGDFESCYHLYEGALIAIKPLLTHRIGLQREINDALVNAQRTTEVQRRAWVLRDVMDLVRTEVRGKAGEVPAVALASLKGTVTLDGEPLPNGKNRVVLWGDEKRIRSALVVNGTYQIDKIPLGSYVVYLDVDDALRGKIDPKFLRPTTTDMKAKFADGTALEGPINLTSTKTPPANPLLAKTPGAVFGKVTVDGKPYAGALVVLSAPGVAPRAVPVEENGMFKAEKLPAVVHKVSIVPPTLGGAKIDTKYQSSKSTPLTVEVLADKATHFDITLKSAESPDKPDKSDDPKPEALKNQPSEVKAAAGTLVTVTGNVTRRGQPLEKGTVLLINEARESFSSPIKDGSYRIPKVPVGKYKVLIQSPDSQNKERLPERYSSTTKSILRLEVVTPMLPHDFNLS